MGRSRLRTLVADAGEPRNARAAHMHGVLSRDGMSPAAILAAGRRELATYGVDVRDGWVTGAARDGSDGFLVSLADATRVRARRLVVTDRTRRRVAARGPGSGGGPSAGRMKRCAGAAPRRAV
ncbi:hypothetical protein STANM309S_06390 [Streptomyces tanashiensis]